MDTIVPRVVAGLVTRLIIHLISTNRNQTSAEKALGRGRHILLKIQATIEDAEWRHITNHEVLKLFEKLLDGMYQGYHALDTFHCRNIEGDDTTDDNQMHRTFTYSLVNPAKRLRLIANNATKMVFGDREVEKLQNIFRNLEALFADLQSLNIFLRRYPCRLRQPYSAYIYIDKCMFGRHVEREKIIQFLFRARSPCIGTVVDVLPIISEPWIGKRTLVENVCNDERVKTCFSFVVNLDIKDLESGSLTAERMSWASEKDFQSSKSLVIIEITSVVDDMTWRRFYLNACKYMAPGSKIILISTRKEAASLGTVDHLNLNPISEEAYWYYFKLQAFGSVNPDEHPRLVAIAMEMAKALNRNFLAAQSFGSALRDNIDIQFWSHALKTALELSKGGYISIPKFQKCEPMVNVPRDIYVVSSISSNCVGLYRRSNRNHFHEEKPELTLRDILTSCTIEVKSSKELVIAWRSPLPPYDDYLTTFLRNGPTMCSSRKA
ncbi:hypothetical protein ACP70R_045795 [Stipagrostis hirtigluma subsp. patula]